MQIDTFGLFSNTLKEAIENILYNLNIVNESIELKTFSIGEIEFFYPYLDDSMITIKLPNNYVSQISVLGFGIAITLLALKQRSEYFKVKSLKIIFYKLFLYAKNHVEAHEIATIIENIKI